MKRFPDMRAIFATGLAVIGAAFMVAPAAAFYLLVHGSTGAPAWFPKGDALIWASAASVVVGLVLIAL